MIKVVLFDLDDTLISENQYIQSGYAHIAELMEKMHGIEKVEVEQKLYALYTESPKYVFNRLFEYYGIDCMEKDIKNLVSEYREHFPCIAYYSDVKNCITKLKNQGIALGIISDGYLVTQKKKAEAVSLQKDFEKIIFTDELGKEFWKPSVKAFTMMKDFFHVKYEEMVYVGDNPRKDFYVKKQIPITTVRICRPDAVYKEEEYLDGILEDICLYSLDDLPKRIRKVKN